MKIMTCIILTAFVFTSVVPSYAQTLSPLMPAPGQMAALSRPVTPPVLKGVKVYAQDPMRFDFLMDNGNNAGNANSAADLQEASTRLVRYFLAALTVPESDLWVNLSPYEKDRIITNEFGLTEMGRDLLVEDYLLKQIMSSAIYPDSEIGKKFWGEVYKKAFDEYGTTDVPLDTFNKVWIVPEKAVVYEKPSSVAGEAVAVVSESHLKVMLESDYLALSKNTPDTAAGTDSQAVSTAGLTRDVLREVVIPLIEKEVNEGENFSQLRQVYQSLILAVWYKRKITQSLMARVYVDQKKVMGVNIDDPQMPQKIWAQYVEAFKKGAYNYIKEEQDLYTGELIPRKYFSGGFGWDKAALTIVSTEPVQVVANSKSDYSMLSVKLKDFFSGKPGEQEAAKDTVQLEGLEAVPLEGGVPGRVNWIQGNTTFSDKKEDRYVITKNIVPSILASQVKLVNGIDLKPEDITGVNVAYVKSGIEKSVFKVVIKRAAGPDITLALVQSTDSLTYTYMRKVAGQLAKKGKEWEKTLPPLGELFTSVSGRTVYYEKWFDEGTAQDFYGPRAPAEKDIKNIVKAWMRLAMAQGRWLLDIHRDNVMKDTEDFVVTDIGKRLMPVTATQFLGEMVEFYGNETSDGFKAVMKGIEESLRPEELPYLMLSALLKNDDLSGDGYEMSKDLLEEIEHYVMEKFAWTGPELTALLDAMFVDQLKERFARNDWVIREDGFDKAKGRLPAHVLNKNQIWRYTDNPRVDPQVIGKLWDVRDDPLSMDEAHVQAFETLKKLKDPLASSDFSELNGKGNKIGFGSRLRNIFSKAEPSEPSALENVSWGRGVSGTFNRKQWDDINAVPKEDREWEQFVDFDNDVKPNISPSILANQIKIIQGVDLKAGDIKAINVRYVASGIEKNMFMVEVELADGRRIKLALAGVRGDHSYLRMQEAAGKMQEKGWQKDLPALGKIFAKGPGKDIPSVYYTEWIDGGSVADLYDKGPALDQIKAIVKTWMRFGKAVGYIIDIHRNNIMTRPDGSFVITDIGKFEFNATPTEWVGQMIHFYGNHTPQGFNAVLEAIEESLDEVSELEKGALFKQMMQQALLKNDNFYEYEMSDEVLIDLEHYVMQKYGLQDADLTTLLGALAVDRELFPSYGFLKNPRIKNPAFKKKDIQTVGKKDPGDVIKSIASYVHNGQREPWESYQARELPLNPEAGAVYAFWHALQPGAEAERVKFSEALQGWFGLPELSFGQKDKDLGGIDLKSVDKTVRVDNEGAAMGFNIDPAVLARYQASAGFMPVIVDFASGVSLQQFLSNQR